MDSFDSRRGASLFTLRQLLDGDLSLTIPDMQRDYCWDGSKVEAFVGNIIDLYMQRRPVTMGLLYGYGEPKGSRRIMVIDGQQRLTTLFLLLGMLYRRSPEQWLRRLIISDYERDDDRQPRLVYQVRSEAMYFISDLVVHFFLDRDGRLSQIEHSRWYFASYDSDPTVRNTLGAVRSIDRELEAAASNPGWDFSSFARFVADDLLFMYYDLGERDKAERMFITINTTGEPLTLPQFFKSLCYAAAADREAFGMQWHEMEQWFWLHRDANDSDMPVSGDSAMVRFMGVWREMRRIKGEVPADATLTEIFDPKAFGSMYRCFHDYIRLAEEIPQAATMDPTSADDMLVLLPSMGYVARWGGSAKPLWLMLKNILRYQRASASGADTQSVLRMVTEMPDADIVSLLHVHKGTHRILNPEERCKLRLLAQCSDDRELVEALIERGQSHPLLGGRIQKLIEWSTDHASGFDVDKLRKYVEGLYQIWGENINQRADLDDVRRALLTLRSPSYPMARRSGASLTLCWQEYEWQRLMQTSPGLVRQIIDRMYPCDDVTDRLRRMAYKFTDRSNEWFFLINDIKVMSQCSHRSLMRPCDGFVGMYLSDTCPPAIRWYIGQLPVEPDSAEWTTMRAYGSRCIYSDHRVLNLAVDIYYTPEARNRYRIEVFTRDDVQRPARKAFDIRGFVAKLPLPLRYDKKRKRNFALYDKPAAVVRAFNIITSSIAQE